MPMTSNYLQDAVMFLAAAVVAVALSRRWGLGAVLGYLAAGVIIGPHVLHLAPRPIAKLPKRRDVSVVTRIGR